MKAPWADERAVLNMGMVGAKAPKRACSSVLQQLRVNVRLTDDKITLAVKQSSKNDLWRWHTRCSESDTPEYIASVHPESEAFWQHPL